MNVLECRTLDINYDYEEQVVYKFEAVLPRYIIIYQGSSRNFGLGWNWAWHLHVP